MNNSFTATGSLGVGFFMNAGLCCSDFGKLQNWAKISATFDKRIHLSNDEKAYITYITGLSSLEKFWACKNSSQTEFA